MCLGIPMRVIEIGGEAATVEASGVRREAFLHLLDGVAVGDYVIVHAGFAIQKLDEAAALETLRLLESIEWPEKEDNAPAATKGGDVGS